MPRKPIVFKPKLHTPQGLNNYSGELFRCFTRGDTLPFELTFKDSDGNAIDITGWSLQVSFTNVLADDDHVVGDQTKLEVLIPISDATGGAFSGDVTDEQTETLADGINYGMIKFTKDTGDEHIVDMAILEVYPATVYP